MNNHGALLSALGFHPFGHIRRLSFEETILYQTLGQPIKGTMFAHLLLGGLQQHHSITIL